MKLLVVTGLLLAIAQRWWKIGVESFWTDEVFSVNFSVGPRQHLLRLNAEYLHPPLYYVGMWLWRAISGSSEVALRSYSALWGVGGVILTALIARRLFGAQVALAVLFLMAVNPLDVYYAQEARMYTQANTLTLVACYAIVRWCCNESQKRRWLAMWFVAAAAATLTHYSVLFVLLGQVVAVAIVAKNTGKQRWAPLALFAGMLLVVIPWVLYVRHVRGGISGETHNWMARAGVMEYIAMFGRDYFWGALDERARFGWVTLPIALALLLIAAARADESRQNVRLIFTALITGLGTTYLVSLFHPVFIDLRTSMFYLPMVALLAAAGIAGIRHRIIKLAVFAAIILIMASATMRQSITLQKTNWRAAAQLMKQKHPEFAAYFPAYYSQPIEYYGASSIARFPDRHERSDPANKGKRIWVFSNGSVDAGPGGNLNRVMLNTGTSTTVFEHRALVIKEVRIRD